MSVHRIYRRKVINRSDSWIPDPHKISDPGSYFHFFKIVQISGIFQIDQAPDLSGFVIIARLHGHLCHFPPLA